MSKNDKTKTKTETAPDNGDALAHTELKPVGKKVAPKKAVEPTPRNDDDEFLDDLFNDMPV